jgi:hypothetical protein
MTRAERHALLGADTVAEIRRDASTAPALTPQQIERIRRVIAPAAAAARQEERLTAA